MGSYDADGYASRPVRNGGSWSPFGFVAFGHYVWDWRGKGRRDICGGIRICGSNDDSPEGPAVTPPSPESVHYHGELHACKSCEYFAAGNRCTLLVITVKPDGGCDRFEARKRTTLRGMGKK